MTVALANMPPSKSASFPPRPKRWTVAEFHRLLTDDMFEGTKPVLLDGEIIEMPNPRPPHDQSVGLADYVFKGVFAKGYWVRIRQSLALSQWSDPMPDLAVVLGSPRDYPILPTTAVLVVEVSDSSIDIDLGRKAALYAAGRIPDYWVVDLNGRQVVVHRDPQPDPKDPTKSRYTQSTPYDAGSSVSPLAMPGSTVNIADLLP